MSETKPEEEKKISRRAYAKYAAAGIVAVGAAAAGAYYATRPRPTPPPTPATITEVVTVPITVPATPTAPPPKKYKGVKLTLIGDAGHNQMPFYWERSKIAEDLGIEYDIIGVPFGELVEKIMTDFATETGAYDVVVFPPPAGGDFYAGGYIHPIDEYEAKWPLNWSDIISCFRELYCSLGGRKYAVTWDGDHFNLYYRWDLFEDPDLKAKFKEQYGYELTAHGMRYDKENLDIAKFFTRAYNPDSPVEYGTSECAGRGTNQWWFFSRFGSAGGIYFDDDMHPLINREEGVRALQSFKDVIPYCPPGVLKFGYDEHKDAFILGGCAFLVQWPCIGKKSEDPALSKIVGKVKYELDPGFDVGGTLNQRGNLAWGRVLAISKFCENPEAAYAFIHYLSAEKSWWATKWVADPRTGLDLFRYYHSQHPELWRKRWSEDIETAGIKWPTLENYLETAAKNIDHGFPELTIPGTFEYYDALSTNISSCLAGEISVKDALDRSAEEWEKITDRLGRDRQKKMWADLKVGWKAVGLLKE